MSYKRIVIRCVRYRHKWRWIRGTLSTKEHPYIERQCLYCHVYEGEVR